MKIFLSITLLLGWLTFGAVTVHAQEEFQFSALAETLFNQGMNLYKSGSYENAAEDFEAGVNINPVHQRTTACYIMAAKSWLNISEQAQAIFLLNNLLKRFPESDYSQDAHFNLGSAYFTLNQYKSSAKEYLSAIDLGGNDNISIKSKVYLDTLVHFILTPLEKDELLTETGSDVLKDIIDHGVAAKLSPAITEEKPKPVERKKTKTLHIGALLPLMGSVTGGAVKIAAEDVEDGMKLALDQFNQTDSDIGVMLDVKDTERDSALVKKYAKEYAGDKEYVAILGPLFSNLTQVCAPIANSYKIPLISPTANAFGIAAMGSYIYQTNADISLHGKALAQYVVSQLGITTIAILVPNNPMLKTVTSQFTAEAKRLGATIVASETYDSSSDDLSKQFLAIRKAGLSSEPQVSFERKVNKTLKRKMVMEGANPELLDSLIEAHGRISVNKLFGKNGLRKAEALNLKIIVPRKVSEQNTDVPATSIQALFAPVVASEDIGIIASQMTYYNIKTQLLGSSEWYDEAQLETQKRYCNGAIFCSDYYLDEEDPSIIAMQQQLKKKPTNYTLFGYDAMKLVLSCIGDGATTREKLHESLSNTQNWHGLHSTITLKGGRVNRVIEILQYKNSDVKRVAEITVEK